MAEPDEPIPPRPARGWPFSMVRLDLGPGLTLEAAAFEVCGASRRFASGVTAWFRNVPMIAFPDQTAGEVADAWLSLDRAEQGVRLAGRLPGPGDTRWTADRKIAVLVAVGSGKLTRDDALRLWQVDEDELREWGARYEMHGRDGLSVRKLQDLGR